MRARIHGWKGKLLSQARKATLLKAVAQAIPIYIMSCFILPKGFIHDINMLIASFWRGTQVQVEGFIGSYGIQCVFPKWIVV